MYLFDALCGFAHNHNKTFLEISWDDKNLQKFGMWNTQWGIPIPRKFTSPLGDGRHQKKWNQQTTAWCHENILFFSGGSDFQALVIHFPHIPHCYTSDLQDIRGPSKKTRYHMLSHEISMVGHRYPIVIVTKWPFWKWSTLTHTKSVATRKRRRHGLFRERGHVRTRL